MRRLSESEQHADVDGVADCRLQCNEDEEGTDIDGVATDLWDLAHRRPEHRTHAISCDEETQTQDSDLLTDAELLGHAYCAGRVYGGADVHGGGEKADLEGDEKFLG